MRFFPLGRPLCGLNVCLRGATPSDETGGNRLLHYVGAGFRGKSASDTRSGEGIRRIRTIEKAVTDQGANLVRGVIEHFRVVAGLSCHKDGHGFSELFARGSMRRANTDAGGMAVHRHCHLETCARRLRAVEHLEWVSSPSSHVRP